jgi:hypothetical protein
MAAQAPRGRSQSGSGFRVKRPSKSGARDLERPHGALSVRLSAGHGPHDLKRLLSLLDRFREGSVGRFMRQILTAGEEPQEGAALLRCLIASCPNQRGISGLEGIQDQSLRCLSLDIDLHLAVDSRQRSEVERQHDTDHFSV